MRCGCLVCVLYFEPEGGRVVTGGGGGCTGALCQCFEWFFSTASNKRTVQLKVKPDSVTSQRYLSSLYAAQCGDICLSVHVDVCWEKLKYGNAMFTKQQGGLLHSLVMLSLGSQPFWWISRVCTSHPSPYLRRFGAPRMWTFVWSDLVRWSVCVCVRVCVVKGRGVLTLQELRASEEECVCFLSPTASPSFLTLIFFFFVCVISSSLSLPPSACCDF